MKSTDTGIRRILKAFIYSRDGFSAAFKSEAALRQDLLVFVVFSLIALFLDLMLWQKALLISEQSFLRILSLHQFTQIGDILRQLGKLRKHRQTVGADI